MYEITQRRIHTHTHTHTTLIDNKKINITYDKILLEGKFEGNKHLETK